jgi:hypothetical protein
MKIIAAPRYAASAMALACSIIDLGEQRQDIRPQTAMWRSFCPPRN